MRLSDELAARRDAPAEKSYTRSLLDAGATRIGEKVREEYTQPAPTVNDAEPAVDYRVLTLEALVRMKLTSFRDKDRTHVRDMLDVGLIDESWLSRLPPELAERLQSLIDTPDG